MMYARSFPLAALALACAVPVWAQERAKDLAAPVQLRADSKTINVDVGHAAPFVGDFAGDGTMHLLVGQFGDGKLRVYRNAGTAKAPRFDKFEWFLGGNPEGRVPSG
jgi:hypothetical protein